ncbi:hypothetical protein LPJ56_003943, partial [Coemansia sp. RSA 2599]
VQFIQHLQLNGGAASHPLLLALQTHHQHLLQQQQQQQQQAIASSGIQGSPFIASGGQTTGGLLSPQQQQQMLLSAGLGSSAAAAANRLGGPAVSNVSAQTPAMTPGNILSPQAMVSPQASAGNATQTPLALQQGPAQAQPQAQGGLQQTPGLQQQQSQQPLDGASQQSLPGQQRMFMGTNIPMPMEFAAEIDRQLGIYRAHQAQPGVDLTSVQQILEQSFLTKYLTMQASRPSHQNNPMVSSAASQPSEIAMLMPGAGSNVSTISPTGVVQQQQQQPLQPQQQQQQQTQAPQQPGAGPSAMPLSQTGAQTSNAAATASTGFVPNAAQHMALVSMLNRQHIQILYNQLRQQIPQTFGNVGFDQFHQYLVNGQLIGFPPVHQMLIMLVQSLQQQQQQIQQQQQQRLQQLASGAALTSAASNRPLSGSVPGLHPGMSPQLQNHQLQLQQQQQQQQKIQQQMGSVRPPNPVMSPSPGQPPLNAASVALAAAASAAAATTNRGSASATPLQQQQQQSGGQRGLKRKSVNSSPATSAAGAPSAQGHQGVNKSPRVMSPPTASKAAQNRSASVVNHPHTPQGAMQSPMVSSGVVATSMATTTAAATSLLAKKEGVNSDATAAESSDAPLSLSSPKVVKSEADAGGIAGSSEPTSSAVSAGEDSKDQLTTTAASSSSASGPDNSASASGMSSQGPLFAGLTSPGAQPGMVSQQLPVSGTGAVLTPTSQQQQQQQMLLSPSISAGNITAAMMANLNMTPAQRQQILAQQQQQQILAQQQQQQQHLAAAVSAGLPQAIGANNMLTAAHQLQLQQQQQLLHQIQQ